MSSGFEFLNLCCICFNSLTPETCAVDTEGQKWDTCRGKCAEDAGIEEMSYLD